eukprot:CAMPEP_0184366984 /NCGR_PEP_ID=MMETSP1089-20130417/156400_1 /TAXON_ID=38269 ORGANISM="Gloeochaete wittrockiana, Strain SAG46.84" /NCGR_SAMPLE_ID=MMETSP1089 /ASSEMBLY_ACC=CAM_ASM_000445 /LENGTH=54 /DNA_ID=CAMNT_0026708811 /DNA_START=118 /DNA_END=279 /DNA_ORIENTATION=-
MSIDSTLLSMLNVRSLTKMGLMYDDQVAMSTTKLTKRRTELRKILVVLVEVLNL